MTKDIIKLDIFKNIDDKLSEYLKLKDLILESDYVEVLGDTFKVVGILRKGSQLMSQKKFVSFLKGFSKSDSPTEEQLQKLSDYINSEQKAEFIGDIFSKILLSKSCKACLIMGSIMQKIVDYKDNLTHEDLVCIDALTKFFDVDIDNYKFICKNILSQKGKNLYYNKFFRDNCKMAYKDESSILLTIEKSVSSQLLFRENEVDLSIDTDNLDLSNADNNEFFRISKPGSKLYDYITKLNI